MTTENGAVVIPVSFRSDWWQYRGQVPVPGRITMVLDSLGVHGPSVDAHLGGSQPMVDEWEVGVRVPTWDQMLLLSAWTAFPLPFFYAPLSSVVWALSLDVCKRWRADG